jgi:O-antigen/teichoic acid export membrane protein
LAALSAPLAAATAHGLRMTVNLVIVKMIAVFIGPAGMGVLGHFMSLSTMVSVFAGGGIGNGITKYVAEYRSDPRQMLRFIGAATVYGLCFSALVFIASLAAAQAVSRALFGDTRYAWLLPCLGAAHLLCFIGTAVISIVNGQQRSDLFAAITISGYLGSLPIAYLLIANFGMEGAALALLLAISCTGIPALWLVVRSRLTRLVCFSIDIADAKRLARFTFMLLASATLFPLAEILIRTRIIDALGHEAAGLWQAMARLSGAYLGFFTIFLSTNYMPRLSILDDRSAIVREVRRNLLIIGVAFAGFACILYLVRESVIRLLFSAAFDGMSTLFGWQLLGDFFRVSSYVIGFLGVAKAAVKLYVAAEFVQSGLYAALSSAVLAQGGGLPQVVQAYALTYFVYLCLAVVSLVLYRRRLR